MPYLDSHLVTFSHINHETRRIRWLQTTCSYPLKDDGTYSSALMVMSINCDLNESRTIKFICILY